MHPAYHFIHIPSTCPDPPTLALFPPAQPPYPSSYAALQCDPFPVAPAADEALNAAEGAFGFQPAGPRLTSDLSRRLTGGSLLSDAARTAAAAAAPVLAPREPRSALLGPAGCAEVVVGDEEPAQRAVQRAARARAAQLHAFWISHLGLVSASPFSVLHSFLPTVGRRGRAMLKFQPS